MPVNDHPVHEKTKVGAAWRYGCNGHASRKGASYYAPDRVYNDDGTFITTQKEIKTEWIEYESCPASHEHQGCLGCIHKATPQKDCGGAHHHRYAGSFGD